ncbi:NAD(P)H-dependent flavin oxidoreductase [Variovorax terrae]|uniref:Nitronate monooxygenase n=1 Tax=Variovorax terrae TaxID=2923278 RepID=A0A9X1W0H0_9BURK|nr:nitronate monooxygenase family protein [Variovorax terrae]MCJ0765437.1 nitronate monooxygenase family protein [Variovorax terrae]
MNLSQGWPDTRIQQLLGIDLPIIQAPMVGPALSELMIAVAQAGGLGSLACAALDGARIRSEVALYRAAAPRPVNLNFFCHRPAPVDAAHEAAWRARLAPYYAELGLDPQATVAAANRAPFDAAACALVEELRPEVVSFHFGLPAPDLLARVRATGAKLLSSATTVEEAVWLEAQGCDAIIAQGFEAGGHRGVFLGEDIATQVGTFALVPQVVDAVRVPVIAAGGIGDARGIAAAFALGAAAVQLGTAYLFCPEARVPAPHREALRTARDDQTVLTRLFTGRPARGLVNRLVRELGPMSALAPAFPQAAQALAPLRARAEAQGSGDFSPLWSGQAARLGRALPAAELTRELAAQALAKFKA